eukprot:TRINITY_DN14295_c0_g1_i3.p2 TRINITY_DN14295_c0_g1~~TRINITY_DN14295_c0_g1_i3.p2  ORF type:complete len:123 (-),score=24.57 TRINITY_DN14295_c0_g1_i3:97-465(-)
MAGRQRRLCPSRHGRRYNQTSNEDSQDSAVVDEHTRGYFNWDVRGLTLALAACVKWGFRTLNVSTSQMQHRVTITDHFHIEDTPDFGQLRFDATNAALSDACLLYTSPSPRDRTRSRMPSSA